ncbi:hypothetical protein ZHAS_00005796 [Anopheles sinensis]|uniref:Uncharacterized protein n=1 Tax=Anopheles sinensis TaxID=74873 RepID=A0A084VK96_ANOSI|nr:hypothetical protein ZHAS_00005796 [Anopheles sinensis]
MPIHPGTVTRSINRTIASELPSGHSWHEVGNTPQFYDPLATIITPFQHGIDDGVQGERVNNTAVNVGVKKMADIPHVGQRWRAQALLNVEPPPNALRTGGCKPYRVTIDAKQLQR